jgi:S-adenosylmethionine uptake transporter
MPLDWGALLAIGLLAQMGQYCFLRAYRIADASVLAPVGYLSILFVTAVGYFLFDEVPEARVVLGIAIILVSLQATAFAEYLLRKLRGRR